MHLGLSSSRCGASLEPESRCLHSGQAEYFLLFRPAPWTAHQRCVRHTLRPQPARAAASEEPNFNPFKRRKAGKEDAAKKALQDMFKDSRDVLAAYDDGPRGPGGRGRGKGGGSGGGGGKDGGSGGGWQMPDWRSWGAGLGKGMRSFLRTLAALLLLVSVFIVVPQIPMLLAAGIGAIKWVLRLEGRGKSGRLQAAGGVPLEGDLGASETSAILKYGGADLHEVANEDSEEEEEYSDEE